MPIWLQVALTLLVPAAGLAGVWLGSQLSAGSVREQWRRDRLLQFCIDLLAASHDVMAAARGMHEELQKDSSAEPPYPNEPIQRMQAAAATIRLPSHELDWPATNYISFVLGTTSRYVRTYGSFVLLEWPRIRLPRSW